MISAKKLEFPLAANPSKTGENFSNFSSLAAV
jgi:hypothetical protein